MKDKLVKHHHKRFYFRLRKIGLISLVCLMISAAVVVPVSISIYNEIHVANVSK